jgi:hypothetical protein
VKPEPRSRTAATTAGSASSVDAHLLAGGEQGGEDVQLGELVEDRRRPFDAGLPEALGDRVRRCEVALADVGRKHEHLQCSVIVAGQRCLRCR